jgi:hypothetical protein
MMIRAQSLQSWAVVASGLLLLGTTSFAQIGPPLPEDDAQHPNPAGPCFLTMTGGSGVSAFKAHLSPTGNVTRFASGGVEHLDVQHAIEGWALCRFFDIPDDPASGGWRNGVDIDAGRENAEDVFATTYTQPNGPNTFPFTVYTYLLTEGDLRLTQMFSRNTRTGTVSIKMNVKNIGTTTTPHIGLQRMMDVDADGTWWEDVAVKGRDFVIVSSQGGTGRGVMLTADTKSTPHRTAIAVVEGAQNSEDDGACDVGRGEKGWDRDGRAPGDYAAAVVYELGRIRPGYSKTVVFTYRAF